MCTGAEAKLAGIGHFPQRGPRPQRQTWNQTAGPVLQFFVSYWLAHSGLFLCLVTFFYFYMPLHFGTLATSILWDLDLKCFPLESIWVASSRFLGTLPTQDHFKLDTQLQDFGATGVGWISATHAHVWLSPMDKSSCWRFPTCHPSWAEVDSEKSLLGEVSDVYFFIPSNEVNHWAFHDFASLWSDLPPR